MTIRIMVIDDEPAIGKLLTYQLTACGYQVSYIQDGLLALHKLYIEHPDLVLLDVMMPLISGWEVCRQIRACSLVPIIMLTGKNAEHDIVTGLSAGADDYVTKPFSLAQLQARIEAVLRRKPAASARQPVFRDPARAAFAATHEQPAAPAGDDAGQPVAPAPPPADAALDEAAPKPRVGVYIRNLRQSRGISLLQAERACNVRWEFLQAIEQENWTYIPSAELRRAMRLYGGYLGLDLYGLLVRRKAAPPVRAFSPRQLAAVMGMLMVLAIVSMYLMMSLHYIRF